MLKVKATARMSWAVKPQLYDPCCQVMYSPTELQAQLLQQESVLSSS